MSILNIISVLDYSIVTKYVVLHFKIYLYLHNQQEESFCFVRKHLRSWNNCMLPLIIKVFAQFAWSLLQFHK